MLCFLGNCLQCFGITGESTGLAPGCSMVSRRMRLFPRRQSVRFVDWPVMSRDLRKDNTSYPSILIKPIRSSTSLRKRSPASELPLKRSNCLVQSFMVVFLSFLFQRIIYQYVMKENSFFYELFRLTVYYKKMVI